MSAYKLGPDKVLYMGYFGNIETLSGGSLSYAANNPGNVQNAPGYIGIIGQYENGSYQEAIFSSYGAGLAAQMGTWQSMEGTPAGATMESAIDYYLGAAPGTALTSYGNEILQEAGLSADSPVPFGSPSQMEKVMEGQKLAEGWKEGSVTCGVL